MAGRPVSVVGLGAWQLGGDWGLVDEPVRPRPARRRGRRRRHVRRHGRRLRRRPQRAAHRRPGARRARTPRSRSPPRWAAAWSSASRTTPARRCGRGTTGRAPTSASTPSTSSSCTARRPSLYADDAVFDELDAMVAEGRMAAYGVSVETLRRGAGRDRAPGRGERADHPQRAAAQAARAGAAAAAAAAGVGDHRPRAAGLRPALGPVRREHDVRGRRPPHLQPARRGLRRGRDVLRRALRRRARGRARARAAWCPPAWPRRSSRCAGSSTSRASRP